MAAATLSGLPEWARELLAKAPVARLGYADAEGKPRVLPVTFAVCGEAIVSAIDAKPKRAGEPARVRALRIRPAAALTVDRYADDWDRLAWVQVLGEVELRDTGADPEAIDALRARYAQYRATPPPGPVLRLVPSRALCWRAAAEV